MLSPYISRSGVVTSQ